MRRHITIPATPRAQEAQRRLRKHPSGTILMHEAAERALLLYERIVDLELEGEVRRLIERAQRRADLSNDLPALPGEAKAAA